MSLTRSFMWLLLLCLAGCGKASSSAGPTPAAGAKPAPAARQVLATTPVVEAFARSVVLHGALEARERVQIAARVAGPIGRLKVELGDVLPMGAVLAVIESAQVLAEQAELNAELSNARGQLARIEGIRNPEAVSRREVDEVRTRVTTTEARLAIATQRVKDLKIVAPFAGTVAGRYVSPGAFVKVGDPIVDFVSTGALRLSLEVPARYMGRVTVGTHLRVQPQEGAAEATDAEIIRVAPALDPQTRTLRVEATVEPNGTTLKPGMFVLATLALGDVPDAQRLPRAAVFSALGQDRVTVVGADGRTQHVDVELLGERDGFAYVRGLAADARVVVQGGASIAPGTAVTAAAASASSESSGAGAP